MNMMGMGQLDEQEAQLLAGLDMSMSFIDSSLGGPLERDEQEQKEQEQAMAVAQRKRKRVDVRYGSDVQVIEEVRNAVQELWTTLVITGIHGITLEEHKQLYYTKPYRHICGETGNCNMRPLHVIVYEKSSGGWSKRHVCINLPGITLCPLMDQPQYHDKEAGTWQYSKFFGCTASGILHHCNSLDDHRSVVLARDDGNGERICTVSGLVYVCNTMSKAETNWRNKSRSNTDMVTQYSLQHESNREERRLLVQSNFLKNKALGTTHTLEMQLPQKDQFVNEEEYALANLRKRLYEVFWGRQRVEKEIQANVQLMTAMIMETVASLNENKERVLYMDQMMPIANKFLMNQSRYGCAVAQYDLVKRHRFVSYYSLYCFFIWCYIRRNHVQVLITQNDRISRQNTHGGAARTLEDAVRNMDTSIAKKQKGEVILDNCAMGILRMLLSRAHKSTQLKNRFAIMAGHTELALIMPAITGIVNFDFVTNANTQTLNMLTSFFVELVSTKHSPIEELVAIPTTRLEEVFALPVPSPYDEAADTLQVRKLMENSLRVSISDANVQ